MFNCLSNSHQILQRKRHKKIKYLIRLKIQIFETIALIARAKEDTKIHITYPTVFYGK